MPLDKNKEIKRTVDEGLDPVAEKRRQQQERKTFQEAVDAYRKKHLPTLKATTRVDYERRIRRILKGLDGRLYIQDLKRYHFLDFLDEIAQTAPVQAQRIQAILSGIFKFALNRDWVDANIATNINFSSGRKAKKKWQNTDFDDLQIRTLWKAFEDQPEPNQFVF